MAIQWGFKEFKAAFFDAPGLQRKIDSAMRQALSKMGRFVRTRAKSSIRKRKKTSPPGSPPSSHESSLRRLLFFAYDADAKSVVVGPVRFRKGEAPNLLEHGGDTTRKTKSGKTRSLHYRGNPFMKPAGDAETPKFREQLKNMVR